MVCISAYVVWEAMAIISELSAILSGSKNWGNEMTIRMLLCRLVKSLASEIVFFGILSLPIVSSAHHAIAGNYDSQTVVEVEGEITSILMRNPHPQIAMRVTTENGEVQDWQMATTALSNMRRWQIDPDFIQVGDTIRAAGNPSIRVEYGLYISNLLTADGEEVLLGGNVQPIWTDHTIEMSASRRAGLGDTSSPELGIFRVWSTVDNIPMLMPRNIGRTPAGRANLTEAALVAVDDFDWVRDNPLKNCAEKGMPLIMEAPYPFEFLQDGENILWHNEEFDTYRTIHMSPNASTDGQLNSLLGYSLGYWEDEFTLVVNTSHVNWGNFDGQGVPASTQLESIERFELSRQGDRLDYSITISDPVYLIEPMTFGKHWVWYPDAEVGVYDCLIAAED